MDAKNDARSADKSIKEKAAPGKNITSSADSNAKNGYISGDRTRSSSSHQFNRNFTDEKP